MIAKKKIIALVLSVVAICSLSGCANKEDTKTEQSNNEVVSQETENNSLLGTWVVQKNEVYDGPLKREFKEMGDIYYYVGAEYEFTEDGKFQNADGTIAVNYEILNDKQISAAPLNSNEKLVYDYKLNGDEFILYGCYTGSYADLGYPSATYFKRK